MTNRIGLIPALALSLLSTPLSAAASETEDCAVLDQLVRTARSDFTALDGQSFSGALCAYRSHEFKCAWGFSSDRYAEAASQAERLRRCTAAVPRVTLLKEKRGETAFQVNPEASVAIRGPDANDGNWKILLKIVTTADWN